MRDEPKGRLRGGLNSLLIILLEFLCPAHYEEVVQLTAYYSFFFTISLIIKDWKTRSKIKIECSKTTNIIITIYMNRDSKLLNLGQYIGAVRRRPASFTHWSLVSDTASIIRQRIPSVPRKVRVMKQELENVNLILWNGRKYTPQRTSTRKYPEATLFSPISWMICG